MLNNPECSLKEFRDIVELDAATELFSMMPLSMAYMKYNNQENNVDALIDGCPYNKDKIYLPNIEKIQKHEEIIDMLESSDIEEFKEYVDSYLQFFRGAPQNFSCIEEPIGSDGMGISWHGVDIA